MYYKRSNYFNISAFGLCFSFISQVQAEKEEDHVLSDTGLKLDKHKVCTYYLRKLRNVKY